MGQDYVYTYAEIDGDRLAATADRDGGNLPGGPTGWRRKSKMAVDEMIASSGIIGMGNAAEILNDVRENGLFLTPSRVEDWSEAPAAEAD